MHRIQQLVIGLGLFLALTAFRQPAHAVIYRHDVDANAFLIDRADYPAVFEVDPGNGGATLIAPQWAVTAAHVTQLIQRDGSHTVTIGDGEYSVVDVVTHPDWGGIHINDIGLFKLDRPVVDITPVPMYERENEENQQVLILGSGDFATGLDGARMAERDGQFRGVTNLVDRIELGSLWVQFDPPEGNSTTELEGVAGPGDSGGPALIQIDGSYHIAGVASFGIEMGNPPPEPGTYGTFDTYTSISRNRAWIDSVLNDEPIPETATSDESSPRIEVIIEADEPAPTEQTTIATEEANIEPKPGQVRLSLSTLIGALLGAFLLGMLIMYFAQVRNRSGA